MWQSTGGYQIIRISVRKDISKSGDQEEAGDRGRMDELFLFRVPGDGSHMYASKETIYYSS